eukprot:gene10433-11350_t
MNSSSRLGILPATTARTYNVYRKKFAVHSKLEGFEVTEFLPAHCLTDENVASFFRLLGEEGEYKPHLLKVARSALQTDLIPHSISPFTEKTAWPLTTLEIKRWNTHLKEDPHFPVSAQPFSKEAVDFLLNLKLPNRDENTVLIQEKAFLVWTVYAAMRVKDVHEMRSKDLSILNAEKGIPRRFSIVLATTKNDPQGTGPTDNREYLMPCDCMERLDSAGKRSFTLKLKTNPRHQCPFSDCGFNVTQEYLSLCPSPFGEEGRDLRFIRSRTTQGAVGFILANMGEHKLKEIIPRLNKLLPKELQLEKATGHTGRHTAASIAVNSGVDSSIIAKVTHHKDPRALSVYQHQDDKVRLSTALAISKSIKKKVESDEEAFIEKDADDDVEECDEGNAFLQAWRLGQKRFRGVYGESDEDYEEDASTKKQKKMINNYYIYNAK